ncbi:MAG: chromosomal replication initiator protein DnaA [Lachnospiraceae bacterium]|jgi:chromosomal replication initiator protein|nr:chromosomal replication initiator protein DnaA [Lachnospiraceae bacterium]MCI9400072.1 chromosomal replication initiator protein DnaA [Lachnospiraceae bacterium]MCX4377862.1 chromosomal replication initiator protein DnaA [Lachnospiraceae bacterium]
MNEIKERWDEIKEILRHEYDLTNISFNTWVAPLQFYKEDNDVVTILIPAEQAHLLNYIQKQYKIYFQVTISELMNRNYDIDFIAEGDVAIPEVKKGKPLPAPKRSTSHNYDHANLNNKYKFDTFVVGSNNKFAHSAALAVAESPGGAYNPLYLYGGAGLGKTHLMHSIGHFVLEQNNNMKVLYVTSEQFTNEVIESIRSGNAAAMTKLREKYRTVDVLLIDDVQFIIGKESTQEEFFHTFNVLHSSGKQIIISSDKPPKEMETLEERFRSRFEWGLIADIQPPDYETRMAILRKNAEIYNKEIDDEIIQYIATNIKSNIRELEGALNKVLANARLNKKELTLALAEDALKDVIYPDQVREVTPNLIIDVVSDHFNVAREDVTSKKRNSEYVLPRQIIMYLCRTMTGASLQNIAALLSKKDHTTIIHGVDKIAEKLKTDEDLRNKIETIKKKIAPS